MARLPRLTRPAAAVVVASLLAAGCARAHREAGLSVLLITVDTLRADALGAYGRPQAETPFMDRLAAGGVRFAEARAQNVVTLPSHANILSGLYPVRHGVRDNAGFRFPGDQETLATRLKNRGYRTGAFVSAFPLDSRFGLDRGFDVYDDRFGGGDAPNAFVMEERPGTETVAIARQWIEAQGQGPFFAWVHLYEPHFPYAPPEPFRSRFAADPYHGEVAAADAILGPLLKPILDAGAAGRTLVVVTSDHGESLGEHGEMTHGIFAYDATLRVPLIVYAPRLFGARVVTQAVRHVDLVPTILDALALDVPTDVAGQSLLGLAAGRSAPVRETYFEALSSAKNRGWAPLYGLVQGGRKLIDLPIPELYDIARDPGEMNNLAARDPQGLEALRSRLAGLRTNDPGWGEAREDAAVRERLRSLGYVAAAAPKGAKHYTGEDDPKTLIVLDGELQALIEQYQAGDLPGALRRGEGLVRRRPTMALAFEHLAFLQREAGDLPGAIRSLEKAMALVPDEAGTAALLGGYLNEAGRAKEALARLGPYAGRKDPDLDVLIAQGVAFAHLGQPGAALQAFARVRDLDATNTLALVNEASVHVANGDTVRARVALEAALALNPRLARAHNGLGVLAAEAGRADEAIAHWTEAITLEPKEYDTLFNLGALLVRAGRAPEARPYLERFLREAPPAVYSRDFAKVRGWLGGTASSRATGPA
jgi:arylsulfatase A-like enzyme/tetratricopeptide (TPR) repeat protein